MNCDAFDQNIDLTLQHYREADASVKLLAVQSAATTIPRFEAMSVMVGVTLFRAGLPGYAETWHYGQSLSRTTEARPSGMRGIDRSRLIGVCAAGRCLVDDAALRHAAVELYWPLLPAVCEPTYHLQIGRAALVIGAYSGNLYSDWSLQQQHSALVAVLG